MSLPRMSWHIGDYKKDTGHLRAAGHGAYVLLCMHYWATGGLPDDDKQLATIACMTDRDWKQIRPIIRAFFLDGWRHKRIDAELVDAERKYQRRVDAGRKGGTAKANGKQKPSSATAELEQPITLTDKELIRDGDARANGADISAEAHAIAKDLLTQWRIDPDDARWFGFAYCVQAWLNAGAERLFIMEKACSLPPRSKNYVDTAMRNAIEERRTAPARSPSPTRETGHVETLRPARPRTGWQKSRDDFRDAKAELDAFVDGAERGTSESGEGIVELLPAARRQ